MVPAIGAVATSWMVASPGVPVLAPGELVNERERWARCWPPAATACGFHTPAARSPQARLETIDVLIEPDG